MIKQTVDPDTQQIADNRINKKQLADKNRHADTIPGRG
jgi:hypothetical protein